LIFHDAAIVRIGSNAESPGFAATTLEEKLPVRPDN
jgi:hypothetical protein